MKKLEQIVSEISDLYKQGSDLFVGLTENQERQALRVKYEAWYTLALRLLIQLSPERIQDFKSLYKPEKRREISYENYAIDDFLLGFTIQISGARPLNTFDVFQAKFLSQLSILNSCRASCSSVLHDVKTVLRAELFDNDIEASKNLLKNGHLRSAGVIAGVVLEAHLKSVAERRSIRFTKKNLTISIVNDGLKDGSAYDTPMWRFIQRLGDIRNLCGHSGDREPTKAEVGDLIGGVEKVIKEVF